MKYEIPYTLKAESCRRIQVRICMHFASEAFREDRPFWQSAWRIKYARLVPMVPTQERSLFHLKFHGEEKPVIKISARTSEDRVLHRIVVEDNGIGLKE